MAFVVTTDAGRAGTTAVVGLGVLLVVLQSSGGFTVDLLGPSVLLAAAGFVVTRDLVDPDAGPHRLREFYGRWTRMLPLVAVTVGGLVLLAPATDGCTSGARAVSTVLFAANWWTLSAGGPPSACAGEIDPLGAAWLVALVVQLGVVWPLVVRLLLGRVPPDSGRTPPLRVAGASVVLAVLAVATGPLLAVQGTAPAVLALGTHVRWAEWAVGAAAAALVARRRERLDAAPATATALVGIALLVASALTARLSPEDWLRLGGPASAALGCSALLVAVAAAPDAPSASVLGRGLLVELGRAAVPLVVLHLPVFWVVARAVPEVRPFALIVLGTALTWLLGLLLHEGFLLRVLDDRGRAGVGVAVAVVLATTAVGPLSSAAAAAAPGARPEAVLLLGGDRAADLAADVAAGPAADRDRVVDGSHAGCGLLPGDGARPAETAVTTARAQVPAVVVPCGDWAGRWADAIGSLSPAAVVVDLGDDIEPRAGHAVPAPCSPEFRPLYRALLDRAVPVWTAGDPNRPVLVLTGPRDPAARGERRCAELVIEEAVARHPALVPLPDDAADPLDGAALLDAVGTELTPARLKARLAAREAVCRPTADPGSGSGC